MEKLKLSELKLTVAPPAFMGESTICSMAFVNSPMIAPLRTGGAAFCFFIT